jgi:hypothetical protein
MTHLWLIWRRFTLKSTLMVQSWVFGLILTSLVVPLLDSGSDLPWLAIRPICFLAAVRSNFYSGFLSAGRPWVERR